LALVVIDPNVLDDHVRRLMSGDLELEGIRPGQRYTQRSAREELLRYWLDKLYEELGEDGSYPDGTRLMPGLGGAWIPHDKTRRHFEDRAPARSVRVGKPIKFRRSAAPVPVGGTPGWHLVALGGAIQGTGAGVRIGIADSGIDPAVDVTIAGYAAFNMNTGAQEDHGAYDYATMSKHGTNVAAFACGQTDGVAPEAQAVVAAVLTDNDGSNGEVVQVAAGLDWLSTQNVDIVNCSWGAEAADPAWVIALVNLLQAGVTVVAAAGNHDVVEFPAAFENVVGIGAEAADGSIPSWSGVGPATDIHGNPLAEAKPDLSMPGVDVVCQFTGTKQSGTSFASPIAAGLLAVAVDGGLSVGQAVANLQADLQAVLRIREEPNLGDVDVADNTTIGKSEVDPTILGYRLDSEDGAHIGAHTDDGFFSNWGFLANEQWPLENIHAFMIAAGGYMPPLGQGAELYVAGGRRFEDALTNSKPNPPQAFNHRYLVRRKSNDEVLGFLAVNPNLQPSGVREFGHPEALNDDRLPMASGGPSGRVWPTEDLLLQRKGAGYRPPWNKHLKVV